MADSDINGLAQAQADYVDPTDELIIQKAGETSCKKIQVDDLFGGWKDLMPYEYTNGLASAAPAFTAFPASAISDWAFGVGDERWLKYHTDHDMKQAATMYPHLHLTTSGTSTNVVRFQLDFILVNSHGVAQWPGTVTTDTIDTTPTGVAMTQYTTEGVGIATPLPDTLIHMRVRRVSNGAVTNSDTVWLHAVDWHYPTQMFATKNRVPNFYAG